jgi:hypothetical protein
LGKRADRKARRKAVRQIAARYWEDEALRNEIQNVITGNTSRYLNVSPEQLASWYLDRRAPTP